MNSAVHWEVMRLSAGVSSLQCLRKRCVLGWGPRHDWAAQRSPKPQLLLPRVSGAREARVNILGRQLLCEPVHGQLEAKVDRRQSLYARRIRCSAMVGRTKVETLEFSQSPALAPAGNVSLTGTATGDGDGDGDEQREQV